MPSPPVSPHTESDAEHTAELPAPDPTAHAHPGEHRMSQTDTWIAPAPPARLTEPSAPATRAAPAPPPATRATRSEEHTSELQSRLHLVCRLLLEQKNNDSDSGDTHSVQLPGPRANQPFH